MLSRRANEEFKGCIPFAEEDGDTVGMRRSFANSLLPRN